MNASLSVVEAFLVAIIDGVTFDVGEVSKVAEDVIVSIIVVMLRRMVVAERENASPYHINEGTYLY